MQHTILFFCFFGLTGLCAQTTLHVAYTVNPHPGDSIHVGCELDGRNLAELFSAVGELARASEAGLGVRIYRLDYEPTAVEHFLDTLAAEPDDGVLFLFSGHGYMPLNRDSRWPLLYFCPENAEVSARDLQANTCGLLLEDIHERLRKKGVRMSLTIGSSCNEDIKLPLDQQVVRQLNDHVLGEGQRATGQGLNFDLFTEYRGHILSSASLPGQLAYLNDSIGSYYVDALLGVLVDGLAATEGASWASILRKTKDVVTNVRGKEQDPQFMIFQDDERRYSDPGLRFADEPEQLRAIEESAYNRAFEREFDCQRAITVLPYILLNELISRVDLNDNVLVEREADRMNDFFIQTVLRPNHDYYTDDMATRLLEAPWKDLEAGTFGQVLNYANLVRPDLGPVLSPQVEDFIESLGQ